MSVRRLAGHLGSVLAIALLVGLVAGSLTGTPVLVSFVETDSMEPTIGAGEGFVAVPAPLAGDVEEGDVIVFEAKQLNGGGLTTHRVVDTTEQGYITRGDANPFTDQDGSEPPVTDAQVRAKALRVNGEVVTVPLVGPLADAVQSVGDSSTPVAPAFVVVGTLLVLVGLFATGGGRYDRGGSRGRERDSGTDVRVIVALLTLVVVLPLTAAMVLPAGTQEYGIVSAEQPTGADHVIEAGETESRVYPAANGGIVPTHVVIEPAGEGIGVSERWHYLGPRSTENVTVSITAPPETGYYLRPVVEYRYVALLPKSTLVALYRVHPWLPVVVIDAVVGGGFYVFSLLLLGRGGIRTRNRTRRAGT